MNQNPDEYGWAGDCCRSDRLKSFVVGGATFWVNARAYDSLKVFVTRFDAEVEPISLDGWDGGYACRDVRGRPGVKSIHSWGLAIDLNATRHPLGKRGTFTKTQMVALRRLLKDFPEIAWGGDYKTRGDEQHFQICKTPAECAAAAAARAKPKSAPAKKAPAQPAKPALRPMPYPLPPGHWFGPESRDARNHSGFVARDGNAIRRIRARLGAGTSGRYDAKLAAKVAVFQRAHRITDDGLVGPSTWNLLKP